MNKKVNYGKALRIEFGPYKIRPELTTEKKATGKYAVLKGSKKAIQKGLSYKEAVEKAATLHKKTLS